MDKEILYASVVKRLGVKRYIAKKAVDWWLKNGPEPGTYLKGAFESPEFKSRIEAALKRGHPNGQQRAAMRRGKMMDQLQRLAERTESSNTC